MLKAWSEFFRDILPDVTGCPDPTIEHALLRAAQDFFETTEIWTAWLDNTVTVAGIRDYDIALPRHAELVRLLRASLDGRTIDIITPECLPADWQTYEGAGYSDSIFTRDRLTLTLFPRTVREVLLRVEAVLRPSEEAEGIDADLFRLYGKTIATGAKASLMAKTGKPWSNPAEAARFQGIFNDAMQTLHFQRLRGFSSARPRARTKNF